MAVDPRIRASDRDRDRTAETLREHHAVGRLDAAEFQERLDRVFDAKTIGELDALTADLPVVDLYPLPTSSMGRTGTSGGGRPSASIVRRAGGSLSHQHGRLSPAWRAAWGSWLGVTLLCTVIWLATGAGAYFWPLWVAGPWGAILAGRWLLGND